MIAAKAMDPVVGVDIHIIQPPGPVPPVPIPHPFVGMVVDPMDFAPIIGATVLVNGMPRATAGTGAKCIPPHIPIGGTFIKPPGNEGDIFMGSATVLADGDPLSRLGMPVLTCHDIGMPAPPRLKKKRKPTSLELPTSVVLAVPAGAPVLVGGPPTISMMALGMKAGMAALGAAFKKLRKLQKSSKKWKKVSKKLQGAATKAMDKLGIPPGLQNRVRRAICTVTGHPVDVATGAVFTEALDLELDGALAIRWERVWYSASTYAGPLGHGWHHSFDMALAVEGAVVAVRLADGRGVVFDALRPGEARANVEEGLTLARDARGYRLRDAGGLTYRFAPVGRAEEHSLVAVENDAGARIRLDYAPSGHLLQLVSPEGRAVVVTWNAAGRIAELRTADPARAGETIAAARYEYDERGDLVAAFDALGHPFRYAYERHLLTRETDRRGYTFLFRYDGDGPRARCNATWGEDGLFAVRLAYEVEETRATFDDGGTWTYRHDGAGLVTALVDPYGGTTAYLRDERGRVVEEVDPRGESTVLEYDDGDRAIRRVNAVGHPLPAEDDDADGAPEPDSYTLPASALEWEYGQLGTVTTGAAEDRWILGQLPPHARETLRLARAGTAAAEPASEQRDALGRLVARRYADGTAEAWEYDAEGNIVAYTDRDGCVTRSTYVSRNLLGAEADALGRTERYEHTRSADLARLVDAGGTEHAFGYDLKGRHVALRTGGAPVGAYVYDLADNLVERLDGQGRSVVRFEIGPGGVDAARLLAGGERHAFEYDGAGRRIAAEWDERLAEFAYHPSGARTADLLDGVGTRHERDDDGGLLATSYLDAYTVAYGVDEDDGDVRLVTDPTGAVHRFAIGWEGEVLKRLADGANEVACYDADGRCVAKVAWREDAGGSAQGRRYAYSAAGDLREVVDSATGTRRYEYDAAHRLVQERRGEQQVDEYAFDAAGNLLRQPGLAGVLLAPANRLLEANGSTFVYDERGNLVERRGAGRDARYAYDALDRLVRVELEAGTWEARYDPLGRRIATSWRGRTTRYWWDGFRLAAEQQPGGRLRLYVYPDDASLVPFMFVEYERAGADPASGRRYFVFGNHLGAPLRVEDADGRVVWSATVDPFGRARVDVAEIAYAHRFPGHYHDEETGLHYNRFRYYSPELGRYLQSDPFGIAGGSNLYAYSTNPLVEVDLDGLAKCGGRPKAKAKPKGKPHTGPKKPQLKAGERDSYKNLKKKTGKGKLDRDHIPSKAAMLERAREIKGRPLTKAEKKRIIEEAETVAVPKPIHKAGPTYGSKNTPTQIKGDAGDLEKAAERDADAMLDNAEKHYGKGNVPDSIKDSADAMKSKTNDDYDEWLESIVDP